MKDTYYMWLMVRFMKDNKVFLIEIEDRHNEIEDYNLRTVLNAISYTNEPRVSRATLSVYYALRNQNEYKNFSDINNVGNIIVKRKWNKQILEAQSIIDSCLGSEHEFFLKDQTRKDLVYLSTIGKKFSGIDGLLKQWIKDLGVLWTSVGALIVGGIVTNPSHVASLFYKGFLIIKWW